MMKMQVCLTLGIALLFARGDTIVSAVFYNLRLVILRVSRNRDKKIIPNTGTETLHSQAIVNIRLQFRIKKIIPNMGTETHLLFSFRHARESDDRKIIPNTGTETLNVWLLSHYRF